MRFWPANGSIAGSDLELIEWAIMIGCIRKYVSWRNNQTRTMIASLKYFAPVLEEVLNMKADPEYWAYLRYRLTRMENEWKQNHNESGSQNAEKAMTPSIDLS